MHLRGVERASTAGLPLGDHDLIVVAPGYQIEIVHVALAEKKAVPVRVDLLAELPPAPPAAKVPAPLPPGQAMFQTGADKPSKAAPSTNSAAAKRCLFM